jgi:poly-gamma-glutamate synthase PgsB/CapB
VSILLSSLIVIVVLLVVERLFIARFRQAVPLIITVTGTRGKSTVARMIGSVLRESGRSVLVKTTGTEAQLVLPDGSIEDVRRKGGPTVLEQKAVLRRAAELKAEVLVAEIMSIESENHRIESRGILQPDIVVITNIGLDHTESMGRTIEDVAKVISLDVPTGVRVFVHEHQAHLFALRSAADWRAVRTVDDAKQSAGTFQKNTNLAAAVTRHLGIGERAISGGFEKVRLDRGDFRIWHYTRSGKSVLAVNAFAANDPDSTSELFDRCRRMLGTDRVYYGMFAPRHDRGGRTLQWIDALEKVPWESLAEVFLVGYTPRAVSHRIERSCVLAGRDPASITESALARMDEGGVLFGFGNTHGIGLELVDLWSKEGVVYGA